MDIKIIFQTICSDIQKKKAILNKENTNIRKIALLYIYFVFPLEMEYYFKRIIR